LENAIELNTDPSCNLTIWRGTNTAGDMKETGTAHWNSPNIGATNSSGFSALPGGFSSSGSFFHADYFGNWWSATEANCAIAWYRTLSYTEARSFRNYGNKLTGYSVRCVEN
jgi:uncharacterized protein (TIGR02145 family)